MPKPFERALTPAEQRVFLGWVIGVSIFYSAIAALIIFAVAIGGHFAGKTEVAAVATMSFVDAAGR